MDVLVTAESLTELATAIVSRCGASNQDATIVGSSLVLSNLMGHDSHGVIRLPMYVRLVEQGAIVPAATPEVIRDDPGVVIVDGHMNFGQVVGRTAVQLAIDNAQKTGYCLLAIRRAAHLGRIGEYAELAARAGLVFLAFVNVGGGGQLVAPHGGRARRLSANPISGAAPIPDTNAIIVDFATSAVAEGKVRVALDSGGQLPPGSILDAEGRESTDPRHFYSDPPGMLLPMAAHKGYGLSLMAEALAGAIAGGGCCKPGVETVANAMFAVLVDPTFFSGRDFYDREMDALVHYVKSTPVQPGVPEILIPGEPEMRQANTRSHQGVPFPERTWQRLLRTATELGIVVEPVESSNPLKLTITSPAP